MTPVPAVSRVGAAPRKGALYPVRLACGHDRLLSGAQLTAGSAVCPVCPDPVPGGMWASRARPVARRLGWGGIGRICTGSPAQELTELRRATAEVRALHSRYRGMGGDEDSCAECSRIAGWHVPYSACATRAALLGLRGYAFGTFLTGEA